MLILLLCVCVGGKGFLPTGCQLSCLMKKQMIDLSTESGRTWVAHQETDQVPLLDH